MERQLIINADDFGLCEGVNRGIARGHTLGVLTSATLMTNMPAARQAVEIAKQMTTLGIGVHLNLTDGSPLSADADVKCLLNADGQFAYSPAKLAMLSVINHKVRAAIRAEFSAQIQWLIDQGITPTHLDSHKHIHSFLVIYKIVCDLAKTFGIKAVRWTYEPKQVSRPPWPLPAEDGKKTADKVRTMAKINRLQDSILLKTDAFFGIAHTGKADVHFFRAVAAYNSARTAEVMTHPGFTDGLDPHKTRLVQQRKNELDALCSERTREYLEKAGIRLVHYGQL